jgi:hypothetical protein
MLYEDEWISFFIQFQKRQFSMKELHKLHYNFSSLSFEDKKDIDRFLMGLASGLDSDKDYAELHTLIMERVKQKQPQPVLGAFRGVWASIVSLKNLVASKLRSAIPQGQPAPQPHQAQGQQPLLAEAQEQEGDNEHANEAPVKEQNASVARAIGRVLYATADMIKRIMEWFWNFAIG